MARFRPQRHRRKKTYFYNTFLITGPALSFIKIHFITLNCGLLEVGVNTERTCVFHKRSVISCVARSLIHGVTLICVESCTGMWIEVSVSEKNSSN
jgi:hypothetical protein